MNDDTKVLHGLLAATVALADLPHPGQVGRVLLGAAIAGRGCSDDMVAKVASLPIDVVRNVMPAMLERCQQVPALLVAKANRTPAGTIYTGIRLSEEAERRLMHLRDFFKRP